MDQNCRNQILSEEYMDLILENDEEIKAFIQESKYCSDIINEDSVVVYYPFSALPKNHIHLYGYGAIPNCYGLLDIDSLERSGVTKIRNIPKLNLQGNGVLIGIIDTGIDYTHEAFRNTDGTSKIFSIWDQSIQTENGIPDGFQYGTQYTKEQIDTALKNPNPLSVVPSVDNEGHGTFLAGIAAGNRNEKENFSGVVPESQIIMVKLKPAKKIVKDFWCIPEEIICYQKNDLMQGIKYLYDTAKKVKRPISLIIGIGTSQGGHDERGALSSYLSSIAAENGVSVSIAAGNEGNSGHHYYGTVQKGQEADQVELRVGPGTKGFSMELWGKSANIFSIDILSPTGEYIPRIPPRLQETREIRFMFEKTVINVDYQLVESQSGDQLILLRFQQPTEGIWRFKVYASGNLKPDFHIWLPIQQFLSNETYFVKSNPEYTLTSPGNTFVPIVATAYDHTNQSLYPNASRGYMRNENISPTLAAPGVNLTGPDLQNRYKTASGTSLAAAHTGGVAAMFLEWGIVKGNFAKIDTVEIKNLLIRGAIRDPGGTYPNKEWGYGILDVFNAYNSLIS